MTTIKNAIDLMTPIRNLDTDQFNILMSFIREERTRRNSSDVIIKKATLSVGDKVSFTSRTRGFQEGVITKIKIKKALVQVGYMSWDVPLTMLNKI